MCKPQKTPEFYYEGALSYDGLTTLLINIDQNLPENKNIVIHINSTGGLVDMTLQMVSYMQVLKNAGYNITVKVHGTCASACFTILQSANKRVVVGKETYILLHNVRKYLDRKPVFDAEIQHYTNVLSHIECKRINTTACLLVLSELKNRETLYKDPQELKRLNFIDAIEN